ncbi:MAG: CDP-alcohol phosphatidyltransferase family protein [Anaerolineae bacterium]|nr:CDP-alcohol phosphatidyltransferase family protein [Anaerolineae bacterium]
MNQVADKKPKTFSDFVRLALKDVVEPLAAFVNRLGIQPNTVTLAGLAGQIVAAYFVANGNMTVGGVIILLTAPFDFLDGTMARLRGEPTSFGAFVDSVTDRYSELVVFGGLLWYYISRQDWLACMLVYLAVVGSQMVPYVRARAESLGLEAKVGVLSRLERYIVLVPALIFNRPIIALWILAVLGNFTAFQRIYHVRKQALS